MASPVSTTTRRVTDHPCQLECTQTVDTVIQYIDNGYFVAFRRKFRSMCLVSETNPESKMFYKSTSEIHEEQVRHLKKFYYMIHPLSEFRITWEACMITVYLLQMVILIPLELCFLYRTPPYICIPKFALDLVCYVDVVMNFYTGYVIVEAQKVELGKKRVAKHYVFGNHRFDGLFLVDVLSSVPVTFCMYVTDSPQMYFMKCLFYFKLFRVKTLFRFIRHYFLRRKFWGSNLRFFLLFVWFLMGLFWFCGSAIYFLNVIREEKVALHKLNLLETVTYIIDTLVELVECIMLVGPDLQVANVAIGHKILIIVYVIVGSFTNMMILSQIVSIYKSRNTAWNKHQELRQEIEQFSTYKGIPPDLKDKIIKHVDFKYHRMILREAEIMNTLSEFLREEVMLFKCQKLVEKVEFFKNLPPPLRIKMVKKLKTEVYMQNEVIFPYGSIGTSMYFINVGSVRIHSNTGKEVLRFEEGKHFGEISVLNNTPRMFTAIARGDCELLALRRSDILEVLKPYPELLVQIKLLAENKEKALQALLERLSIEM